MDTKAKFWDKIATKYARSPISDEVSYRKKLAMSQSYFNRDMDIIELGCGTGSTALEHAPFVKHILAVDISDKMLEFAKQRAKDKQVKNISFMRSSVEEFSHTPESADALLALNLLHLLENHKACLNKIHSLLKPGGLFISSTVAMGDMNFLLKLAVRLGSRLRLIPAITFFTQNELEDDLVYANFSIEEVWKPEKGLSIFIVARKI